MPTKKTSFEAKGWMNIDARTPFYLNAGAVTLYATQARSQFQTRQPFPTVGSLTKGMQENGDGANDVYSGPLAPWIDKT
ncbi:MAG: hypothetical protein ACJA09_000369 [Alcanivorax sp.]|jgi:hypothetical protein